MKEVTQRLQIVKMKSFEDPLNKKDVADYIEFKLKLAGCRENPFDSEALKRIAEIVKTPLETNIICRRALIAAANIQKKEITLRIVENVLNQGR